MARAELAQALIVAQIKYQFDYCAILSRTC
jgi:hypothetical protein